MKRPLLLLALALPLAACGGSSAPKLPFPAGAKAERHDVGGGWSVAWASAGGKAYAVALHGSQIVRSAGVRLRVLGPDPGSTAGAQPQVAVEIRAPQAIDDSTILVDGTPLSTNGGGPSPSYQSIYGAPASSLGSGTHVAVAFARAGGDARAVAWTFRVG